MTTDTKAPGGASLVINRAKWLRGEGIDSSFLLRGTDGRMCCLGFLGLSCGIPREVLNGNTSPQRLPSPQWPAWLLGGGGRNSPACFELMHYNDNEFTSEEDREREIAAIFVKHGVTVTFIDGDSQ